MNLRLPNAGPVRHARAVLPALALLALAALAAGQSTVSSIASGVFTNPAIWSTGRVPGSTDDVTISASHTIGMTGAGLGSRQTTLGSVTVDGTLRGSWPPSSSGAAVDIVTASFTNNGLVRGEDGGAGPGGDVRLSTPIGVVMGFPPAIGFLPGTFTNNGTVLGGNGSTGGSVRIWYPISFGMPSPGFAMNNGAILGGNGTNGGDADMTATVARNLNGGLIRGGNGTTGSGGNASLHALQIPPLGPAEATNAAGATVRGGDSASASGGDADVTAMGPPGLAPATNSGPDNGIPAAAILGGDGCRGGSASLFGTPTVNGGILAPGLTNPAQCPPPPRRTRCEPPEGFILGTSNISGDIIELVAGSSLVISGAPVISAAQELRITLAPGGVLDLSALAPGSLSAPLVTISADQVLTPPGTPLSALVSGATLVAAGSRDTEISIFLSSESHASFGATVDLPLIVANTGNMTETVSLEIIDVNGVLAGPSGQQTLVIEPLGAFAGIMQVRAPSLAFSGQTASIQVNVTTLTPGGVPFSATATHSVTFGPVRAAAEVWDGGQAADFHFVPMGWGSLGLFRIDGLAPFLPAVILGSPASTGPDGMFLGSLGPIYPDLAYASLLEIAPDGLGTWQAPASLSVPALQGMVFHLQAAGLHPFAPNGIVLTNGLNVTLGP